MEASLPSTIHGIHDVYAFALCLLALFVFDLIIIGSRIRARWFAVHTFANFMTVIFTTPAIIQWLRAPLTVCSSKGQETPDPWGDDWLSPDVLLHPSNNWGVLFIVAVHSYHCLAFKLSSQDLFHHFMFVPTIGVAGGLMFPWGPIRNVTAFFISGLPGGIDYFMLVLLKNNLTTKLKCKRLSSKLNLWLRGPGIGCLVPATMYICWSDGRLTTSESIMGFLVAGLTGFNGLYYMDMSIKNYQMHLTRAVIEAENKVKSAVPVSVAPIRSGKDLEYWQRKEEGTVQRHTGVERKQK